MRYIGAHSGICFSIFENRAHLILQVFVQIFFRWAKKNSTGCSLLLEALRSIFAPILSIFFNVLRNLKYSLDILHECIDIIVEVTKLKFGIPSSALDIFACFWFILYYVPQRVRNRLTFS